MNPSIAHFLRIAAAAFATLLVALPAAWALSRCGTKYRVVRR